MVKNAWFYLVAAAMLGAGGWFYVEYRQTVVIDTPVPASSPVVIVEPKPSDDALNRRRQESIGSIRDLKPVPIEPTPSKAPHK